ncbi:MAG TPA: fused MFS/spermidine synthase [Polyangiaceae bacterium]|nr:fused MFS/spermidine synthase [Polyangiaceae bacterium]
MAQPPRSSSTFASDLPWSHRVNLTSSQRLRILSALFFLSGFSALAIELVFVKYLGYVFGTTAYAVSTVLAAFMLGLSLGNVIGGSYAERIQRRLRWYGTLELLVGGFAVLSPLLFQGLGALVGWLGHGIDDSHHGVAWLTALRFTLAALVVLPPTVAMGISFPLLVRSIRDLPNLEGNIGRLYTINTFGAAIGTLACTYAVIASVGLLGTLALVLLLNACVFLGCWFLDRSDDTLAPARYPRKPPSDGSAPDAVATHSDAVATRWFSTNAIYAVAGISGFVSLAFEVLWSHLLATVVGTSTYAFGLVLAVFLMALAISGAIVSRFIGRLPTRQVVSFLGLALLLTGISVAHSMSNWDRAGSVFELVGYFKPSFVSRELTRAAVVLWLILLPALAIGLLFPTALCLQRFGHQGLSRRVGVTYAINTAGTIVGSTLTGFWLIEGLGSQTTMRLLGGLVTVPALPLLWTFRRPVIRYGSVAAGLWCCGSFIWSTPWDIARMTSGANIYFAPGFDRARHRLVDFLEDVHGGMTTIVSDGSERTLMTNGKFEGNNGPERLDQVLFAAIPNLYVSHRNRALNIGIGTGQTASVLHSFGYRDLDAVDISPNIVTAARRWFNDVHHAVFDEPNVHVLIRDGRNHLLLTQHQYDLISIELTSIWFASAGNLYSREFYELCSQRLTKDGVLQQWVQLHHIELADIATIVATMKTVFPEVELWLGGHQGILIAGKSLRTPNPEALREISVQGKELLGLAGLGDPTSILSHRLVTKERMNAVLSAISRNQSRLSTDSSVVLEYSTPRGNALDLAEEANLAAIRASL